MSAPEDRLNELLALHERLERVSKMLDSSEDMAVHLGDRDMELLMNEQAVLCNALGVRY